MGPDAGGSLRRRGGGALSTLGQDWDNDDVHVRPTRGGSRPRTKTRPSHTDAVSGFVVTVDRGRYTCLVGEGTRKAHVVTAMRARELGRRAVAVGDRVDLVGDIYGAPDTLARIVRIATAAQRAAPIRRRHRPAPNGCWSPTPTSW